MLKDNGKFSKTMTKILYVGLLLTFKCFIFSSLLRSRYLCRSYCWSQDLAVLGPTQITAVKETKITVECEITLKCVDLRSRALPLYSLPRSFLTILGKNSFDCELNLITICMHCVVLQVGREMPNMN